MFVKSGFCFKLKWQKIVTEFVVYRIILSSSACYYLIRKPIFWSKDWKSLSEKSSASKRDVLELATLRYLVVEKVTYVWLWKSCCVARSEQVNGWRLNPNITQALIPPIFWIVTRASTRDFTVSGYRKRDLPLIMKVLLCGKKWASKWMET